jgi:SNF2 family DNA or RNA helicase
MGLGKTIQVLAHLLYEKHAAGADRKPALVVVPRTLLTNWVEEARRFAPELVLRQHWGPERSREKDRLREADVVLTTYGTLRLDIALLSDFDFASVVLDEAQAIKNRASATARCAKLLRAERRLALSGTPVENHLGELWSLFEFLNQACCASLLRSESCSKGRALASSRSR